MAKQSTKQIASNRKAFHDYFIEDKYEAGIELAGTEVKSIRLGAVNLRDSEGCCSTAGRSASSRPGCSRTATR